MAFPHYPQNGEITYVPCKQAEENPFLAKPQTQEELPRFEEIRARLPQPEWQGHEDTLDCYWKAWALAFGNLRNPAPDTRFVSPYIDAAFNGCIFMWDSCFMLMFGKYAHPVFNFQQTLDNFYSHQHKDGFISREINEQDDSEKFSRHDPSSTGPNVMPWCEWEYYLLTGDTQRIRDVFPALLGYHRWLRDQHTWPDGSYWSTGLGCGMDNQPRQQERENHAARVFHHGHMVWVDACMQQIISCNVLISMAAICGKADQVADLQEERVRLQKLVNEKLWDAQTGFYYDLWRNGQLSHVKTIGSYWALLADVVPPERMNAFVAHLDNEREFKRPNRVPTLAADDASYNPQGGYWCGSVWAPTNYMVLSGLRHCGYDALAHDIAKTALENVVQTYKDTGTLWENYAPESSKRGSQSKGDFVGWSGLFPISMLIEYVFGLEMHAEKQELVWHIDLTEAFGVKQLPFGTHGTVDLHCAARQNADVRPQITVRADTDLTLTLVYGNQRETRHITATKECGE